MNTYSTCYKLFLRSIYPGIKIDKTVFIEKGVKILMEDGGKLSIVNTSILQHTYIHVAKGAIVNIAAAFIGRNCVITSKESIAIKSGVEIAEMTVIRDQDHDYRNKGQFITAPITIEKNVWLANKVTVTKGVTIGENSVIGANSVVIDNIPKNCIAVGIPAEIIKTIS